MFKKEMDVPVSLVLVKPKFQLPLDGEFRPAVLADRFFQDEISKSGASIPLVFGLEFPDGSLSRYETWVYSENHMRAPANLMYAERIFKFLLWQHGGWKVYVGGPESIGRHIASCYAPGGHRAFDSSFMGGDVYDKSFTVIPCGAADVPDEYEPEKSLGRHLDGCRIGFDLGASDLKVSAVIDGRTVFSEEKEWNPGEQNDPQYHYQEIMMALSRAASHLPKVDAVGGSSAGVFINNRAKIASLFRKVPKEKYDEVRNLFLRIKHEMNVPLEIVNDGEVTALAGSMTLEDNSVLGIALGSSEAGGYVNSTGNITGWLNELAFAPIDYSPKAPVDEWSGDRGCGASYLSQQCVFRLAPLAGIDIPVQSSHAEKLKYVQNKLKSGDEGALNIWRSMGIYLGYAVAHYADFYALKHVLILGRCTSGRGGSILLESALNVLKHEFPELAQKIRIHLPDEKSRRVGQSIAAASLPVLTGEHTYEAE